MIDLLLYIILAHLVTLVCIDCDWTARDQDNSLDKIHQIAIDHVVDTGHTIVDPDTR